MKTLSRRTFVERSGIGLAATSFAVGGAISRAFGANEAEKNMHEKRQAWYWDSVVNIHFDNGGRPLAKGISLDLLTSELQSIPADMIQVCAYGGPGLQASFPWKGSIKGFAQPDQWDSLAVWSEVARRTGKRFHIYTNTYNGSTPEDLAAVNPQFQGDRYGTGYQRFMQDVCLPILNQALARYHPQGVWVDGSEALVRAEGYRRQIADIVHKQNSIAMMTFNHSWLNLSCGWPDPRTPPSYVDTLSFDRVPVGGGLAHSRVQGMFYSSFTGIPHDMMHCVDRPGETYEQLLPGGGVAMASGGSWFLWVDNTNRPGESFLESMRRARNAALWAIQRKPALGRTRSANRTAVLVSETQWKKGGRTYGNLGPAGLAWDDEVPLVQACALSLQDQGFLIDIVNEETLVQHATRYQRVFVPGNPQLDEATDRSLHDLESHGATVVWNAPTRPFGHAPDIQAVNNTEGCVFSLRQQVTSNYYVLHVVDLREQKRSGMSCSLPLPAKLKQVQAYPSSVKVTYDWSNGQCTITLKEFEVHTAIVFDCLS